MNTLPPMFVLSVFNPRSLAARAFSLAEGFKEMEDLNKEELRVLEIPAGNGTGSARSVAELYGCAATNDPRLGLTASTRDSLEGPAIPPTKGLRDKVLHIDTSFSLGFGKPTPTFIFGSSARAYGWPGAGGSFGFADPDTGIGYGYVMNKMGYHTLSDPRELALRQALFRDVLGARSQV
jgi:CubicO group peptidase (beta-lactamase class C family)